MSKKVWFSSLNIGVLLETFTTANYSFKKIEEIQALNHNLNPETSMPIPQVLQLTKYFNFVKISAYLSRNSAANDKHEL